MNKGLQALKRLQGENRVGIYDETDICQDFEMAEYYLQAKNGLCIDLLERIVY